MNPRLVIIAALAAILPAIGCSSASNNDSCPLPEVVAHRGGWADVGRTENTIGAYVQARVYGLLEWETDIRFDRYGVPFLMHDSTIDRTTNGTGPASAVDIATTTARMNDGTRLADQTLDRLLSYAAKYGATVAIEPKVIPTASHAARLLALLDKYGMRGQVLFRSFHAENLAPFKTAAPDLTYSLVSSTAVPPATAAAVGPILNIRDGALTEQLVADYHAAGVKVYAWTVDTPAAWTAHRNWGIDRYVSDNPVRYRAWRDWACSGDTWTGGY
jgi:glycerophosphoryl diester phosphodiesterase